MKHVKQTNGRSRPFTEEEIEFIRAHYAKKGPTQLGKEMKRSTKSMKRRAEIMGLKVDKEAIKAAQDLGRALKKEAAANGPAALPIFRPIEAARMVPAPARVRPLLPAVESMPAKTEQAPLMPPPPRFCTVLAPGVAWVS